MTPHQIDLVQASFAAVPPIRDQVAADFYARLFDLDPALRGLFPSGDMAEQGRKLTTVLGFAVGGLRQPDAILPAVRDLGRRHVGYGVRRGHYATVGQALLDTLAAAFGDAFTEDLRAAWAAAYALLSGTMLAAAEAASATAPA